MTKLVDGDVLIARNLLSLFQRLFWRQCHHILLLLFLCCRQEISRNAVSPPKLAADAPVLNVLHPVAVGVHIFRWVELDFSLEYWRQGNVSKMLHREEPLLAETRLHSGVLVTLRVTHLVIVVLHLLHQASFLQVDGNLLAHLHSVHTHIQASLFRERAVRVEDVDGLQVMSLTQCVVVHIVSRCHLQTARTKLDVHITVFYHRNNTIHQRHNHLVASQPLVLRVFRIDTHSRVTHDGLRTRGGNHSIIALGILMNDVALLFQCLDRHLAAHRSQVLWVSHIIFQMIQVALLITIDHLLRREHRLCLWIPVHHTETTIDQSLLVEVHKHLQHTLAALRIHREGSSVPVARSTQMTQLLQNDAAVLVRPSPCMLEELLTREVALLDALFSEAVHHLRLCGNRSMVRTRHPTSILAVDASLTDKDVLNRVVEHVTHVEHTRHIWWRNHNRIGFTPIRFTGKKFVVKPVLIPLSLHRGGVIIFR